MHYFTKLGGRKFILVFTVWFLTFISSILLLVFNKITADNWVNINQIITISLVGVYVTGNVLKHKLGNNKNE